MAQKKSHEVDVWLARPSPETRMVLCYGPDRGLVSERAHRFARSTGLPLDDPFVVIKLDADALEKDPGRLIDEANAVAMFASSRLIWIKGAGAGKRLADDFKFLAGRPPRDTIILIEAGDLKKGAGLRSAAENAPAAMALPCYADEERAVERLIDEELGLAGLSISLDARRILRDSLGGDRLATRGELQKLALYMHGGSQVERADVEDCISDVSQSSVDDVIDAALAGDVEKADAALSRALSSSSAVFQTVAGLMRQFQALHLMRGVVNSGTPVSAAVASARPPILFSRRQAIEAALSRWSIEQTQRTLVRLQTLVLATRKRPELAAAAIRQVVLGIALEATAGRRRTN